MCGIAGWVALDPDRISVDRLWSSTQRLAHRGPDGQGVFLSPDRRAGLAHTRLAIVDVAGGEQPLANEDQTIHVVFNGEIYNHVELRAELEKRGHRFATNSDTETIVHLYEEHGEGLFSHLNGMFAIALWDQRRSRLVLGRDRLGKKPLFVRTAHQEIVFASELKGLVAFCDGPMSIDPAAVDFYLTFQYVPSHLCFWEGIRKLEPGCWLSWQNGETTSGRYWQAPDPVATFRGDRREASEEFRRLLTDAIRIRLRADVPVGALLSGGLDSSVIVALATQAGATRLSTFSAGFEEGSDERAVARAVARHYGTDHHELMIQAPSRELIDQVIRHYDEPLADTSCVPTWQLCELARGQVKVALTGDGGDESLLGYDRYGALMAYERQRTRLQWYRASGVPRLAERWLPSDGPRTWRRRLRSLAHRWERPLPEAYLRWLAAFDGGLKRRVLTPNAPFGDDGDRPTNWLMEEMNRRHRDDWASAAAAFDLISYLPDAVLTKVDRASMAHGLECRSPFLDYRVVEFLATLPASWKRDRRQGKLLLREMASNLLPSEVWSHPKSGFGAPVGRWLKGWSADEARSRLIPKGSLETWFDRSAINELFDEHRRGDVDHSHRLWTLTCLSRFAE